MDDHEKIALRKGAAIGAVGMLLLCLLMGWLLLPGFCRYPMMMLKLGQIVDTVDREFVGDFEAEELGDFAAYGMMQSLGDRYSNYLPADAVDEYEANKYGETFGVGISCIWDEEQQGARVYRVLEGSSALEQGLQIGDWITAAGGVTAAEDGYEQMIEAIRGEEGTEVDVTVHREGEPEPLTMSLERRRLTQLMAEGEMLDGQTGLIRIFSFHQGVSEQFNAAYQTLKDEGMQSLVIDVRHDSGGLVAEMTKIADRFLPECDVMIMRRKNGHEERKVSDAEQDEIPMAVLVDEQSYSAAEFFAALMQEYGRAVTVGAQTTGKERAQDTYHLVDGSAIVLSNQQYLTPGERALGETGMTPDILTALPEGTNFFFMSNEEDSQLQAAVEALRT